MKVASGVCLGEIKDQCMYKAMLPLRHVSNNTQFNLILTQVSCPAVFVGFIFHKSI